ncbi:DUF7344 domain-containing protein [Halosimplex amylolyticum]|uniref:DUF7344 domain-containing protein n=1 Tax=Halosimplex amylolyticum TaxID=3396616 RepID=UPI003F571FE5
MTGCDESDGIDTAFELLADRRRRAVIEVLRTAPHGSLELPALVEGVASKTDDDPDELAPALYHTHLPKLDDAGVIDFDGERGVVDYDSAPLLERCLDVAETYRTGQWARRCSK